ncbi:MAG: site-specific DNA-methyltransferase [Cytophagales bacterium]|nr:MAG: site-specific DNA-methyltransferase [Cytophagales bacterium]
MLTSNEYTNKILQGDCIEVMKNLPDKSVDIIFADPPYNLQLKNELYRPNQTRVDGVFDEWDKFESMETYDIFTQAWLKECKRVLKDNGTIWVIGSYHNIFRVGAIMQNLGLWFLNDIIWVKTNPMPNFKGTRFNNAHETLIWASKNKNSSYTFHYKALKVFNDDLQMRSDWHIPICGGEERIKVNGQKAHSTQKPAELLYRVILSSSNPNDLILDPFNGSGTTAAVAKRLGRNYIGIEKESDYIKITEERLKKIIPLEKNLLEHPIQKPQTKVPFGNLIEKGFIKIGESLYSNNFQKIAKVLADASLTWGENVGSIHKISALMLNKPNNNGWKFWYVERENQKILIDDLRQDYIKKFINPNEQIQYQDEKVKKTIKINKALEMENYLKKIIEDAKNKQPELVENEVSTI